jgi:hypothetical protein
MKHAKIEQHPASYWLTRVRDVGAVHGLVAEVKTACVIWWDKCGNLPWRPDKHGFLDYLEAYKFDESTEPPEALLVEILVGLGYKRSVAKKRARPPRNPNISRNMRRELQDRSRAASGTPGQEVAVR